MPVVIGAKPESNFRDPIGLLADCHRRIERFLSVLVRLAAKANVREPLGGEERIALDTALRYFREAAPKHTRDEEDSLFPRLRSLNSPEVQSALSKMEKLEREHLQMERIHAGVDRLGQEWLAAGTLSPADAARLSELVSGLADTYREHIAVEEREVFPAAAALAGSDRTGIGGEMARRRGLDQRSW